jgi:hypothetical protein
VKRWALLLSAAAIVIVANSVVLSRAARNRAGEPEGEVELTERELRLEPGVGEQTWASLRIDWNSELQWRRKEPGWFDREKLASLGFDCRLAQDDPEAEGFYAWQPAREVWVVLELEGEARRATEASVKDRASSSRLFAVDAGTDAQALRARYPDRGRFLLARALVSAGCFPSWDPGTRTRGAPFIRGTVLDLLVGEIQVPREKRALLDSLAARDREARRKKGPASDDPGLAERGEPRYRVRLRYGRLHAPWVEDVTPVSH